MHTVEKKLRSYSGFLANIQFWDNNTKDWDSYYFPMEYHVGENYVIFRPDMNLIARYPIPNLIQSGTNIILRLNTGSLNSDIVKSLFNADGYQVSQDINCTIMIFKGRDNNFEMNGSVGILKFKNNALSSIIFKIPISEI